MRSFLCALFFVLCFIVGCGEQPQPMQRSGPKSADQAMPKMSVYTDQGSAAVALFMAPDSHEYIVARGYDCLALVHAAGCKTCKANKENYPPPVENK